VKPRILVLVKYEKEVDIICEYFSNNGYEAIAIDRHKIFENQQIAISDDKILYYEQDLLECTAGAIILDSGYMWPQPVVKPTLEKWMLFKNNVDKYFKYERETSSLWYSLLEILNDSLPLCINPQEAFEAESFKPWAFDMLDQEGVNIPPIISGNDKDAIMNFIDENNGKILSIPLYDNEKPLWVDTYENGFFHLEEEPVMLQALSRKETIRIIAVKGKPVYTNPNSVEISELADQIPKIQDSLKIPFAELIFRYTDRPVLSDFSASPAIHSLSKKVIQSIMDALLALFKGKA